MQFIKPDVSTICIGHGGLHGRRAAGRRRQGQALLPAAFARMMIHQPLGGFQGQAADMEIHAREMLDTRDRLNKILAKHTGQSVEKIKTGHRPRQFHGRPTEAMAYGLIDKVLESAASSDAPRRSPGE